MNGYGDTYYARTLTDMAQRPSLEGLVAADVALVGGGLAGLTAALGPAPLGRPVGGPGGGRPRSGAGWRVSGRRPCCRDRGGLWGCWRRGGWVGDLPAGWRPRSARALPRAMPISPAWLGARRRKLCTDYRSRACASSRRTSTV